MKSLDGVWTEFWDMHSGGGTKFPPFDKIYVRETEEKAEEIFTDVTGECPRWVACNCCGANYSVTEYESLAIATKYHRRHQTVEEYAKKENVLLIFSDGSTNKLIGE